MKHIFSRKRFVQRSVWYYSYNRLRVFLNTFCVSFSNPTDCIALGIRSNISVYRCKHKDRLKMRHLFVLNNVCERPKFTSDLISYMNYCIYIPLTVIIIGFGGVFVFCRIV